MTRDAYIAAAVRTPVGRAPRGVFCCTRPDDLLAHALRAVLDRCPGIDGAAVDDVIVGCAMPEAEQGYNVGRVALLLAGFPDSVPGMTVNRFCASSLEAIALAASRIRTGEADVIVAGGTESMSMIPMGGHKPSFNPAIFESVEHIGIAYGMGLTAERVAQRFQVSRDDQDRFALESHRRAVAAIDMREFEEEIAPFETTRRAPELKTGSTTLHKRMVTVDEGPRRDTSIEALSKLKPVFLVNGSVTAGNSSQMSDGAAALLLMSDRALARFGVSPLGRWMSYAVAGVAPEMMGVGPIKAVPRALERAGIGVPSIDWIELNEAFAAQSLVVMRELKLDRERVNPLGGAIALGHPLGATGAIRAATLLHGLRRHRQKYGMVTMCIGTGMGAASVFEAL